MDPVTVPNSVFIDNQWFAATWLAEIVDDSTGELIITATIEDPARVVALSMNMDLARHLRAMAMQQTAEPYDCRTTEERLAVQEDRLQILSATMRRIVAEIDRRLDALEERAEETDDTLSILRGRIDNNADALAARLGWIDQRLEVLEEQAATARERVGLDLPGADYMREQYDAENDAAPRPFVPADKKGNNSSPHSGGVWPKARSESNVRSARLVDGEFVDAIGWRKMRGTITKIGRVLVQMSDGTKNPPWLELDDAGQHWMMSLIEQAQDGLQ